MVLDRAGAKDHILCINDTRLTEKKTFKFKGYKTFRRDHPSNRPRAGGVIILAKNDMKAKEVDIGAIKEMLAIDVQRGRGKWRIATVYLHPGEFLTQSHLDALMENGNLPNGINGLILMGDMNAHVGISQDGKIDRAGQIFKSLATQNNLVLQNDDSPTYFSASHNYSACIDLCLTKQRGNGCRMSWSVDGDCGSDHLITKLELHYGVAGMRFQSKIINWSGVRNDLQNYTPSIKTHNKEEIDRSIDDMNLILNEAVSKNSSIKTFHTRNGIRLSKETADAIELRRKLNKYRKRLEEEGKNSTLVRHLANKVNRETKRLLKRDEESSKCSQIEDIWSEPDAAKSWKKLKDFV